MREEQKNIKKENNPTVNHWSATRRGVPEIIACEQNAITMLLLVADWYWPGVQSLQTVSGESSTPRLVPASHVTQFSCPIWFWYLPTRQRKQYPSPLASLLWYPFGHSLQSFWPTSAWNLPIGQASHAVALTPRDVFLPAGHFKQTAEPGDEYSPRLMSHGLHEGSPIALENSSRRQSVHLE